jgi:hypothetical protein
MLFIKETKSFMSIWSNEHTYLPDDSGFSYARSIASVRSRTSIKGQNLLFNVSGPPAIRQMELEWRNVQDMFYFKFVELFRLLVEQINNEIRKIA